MSNLLVYLILFLAVFSTSLATFYLDYSDSRRESTLSKADEKDAAVMDIPELERQTVDAIIQAYPLQEVTKAEEDKPEKIVVNPRLDEHEINGELLRLTGLFKKGTDHFAVFERRDGKKGKSKGKLNVRVGDNFGDLLVANMDVDSVEFENSSKSILFKIYKKPIVNKK